MRSVEPRIHRHQVRETLDQQTGADHQRDGERHLADHERAAHPAPRADGRRPASRFSQCESEIADAQMQRRRETEDHARADGDEQREREHAAVDADGSGARNALRSGSDEDLEPESRQRHSSRRAGDRQHEALGDELPDQSSAPGTECGAKRELLVTTLGADEQQVGEIRARDEEDEPNRGLEKPQRPSDAADDVRLQVVVAQAMLFRVRRVNVAGAATLGRRTAIAAVEDIPLRHHRFEIAARTVDRHAIVEPADERQEVAAAELIAVRRIDHQWQPHLHAFVVHVEAARHDADHRAGDAVHLNLLPDEWASAERALPEVARDHDD